MELADGNKMEDSTGDSLKSGTRRWFFWISTILLFSSVVLVVKILVDFFGYAPGSVRATPFTVQTPSLFPHLEREVWITRDQQGLFAFSGICPHLGCKPIWKKDVRQFHCPCHKSVFAADGSRISGPAPTGLKPVWIAFTKEGAIRVDPNRKVSPSFRLAHAG